ncbi:lysozyme inhibitor LprI family protein [Bradyrhizobium sp. RT5a]|uniref:lysozyme inhibitor LprI family protein n=1 Tax=unclassified Bradyrhizobium TaxID=2631580 RepID=UPI0033993DD5
MDRAICGDVTLAQWDAFMGRTYQQALRISKDRQALLESQRNWLTQRETTCSSVTGNLTWSCILDATRSRKRRGKARDQSTDRSPRRSLLNSVDIC